MYSFHVNMLVAYNCQLLARCNTVSFSAPTFLKVRDFKSCAGLKLLLGVLRIPKIDPIML